MKSSATHCIPRLTSICIAACLTTASANATPVLIDFGFDESITEIDANNQHWNNVSGPRTQDAPADFAGLVELDDPGNLIDSSGADSGYTFAGERSTDDDVVPPAPATVRVSGEAVDFTGDLEPNPTGTVYDSSAYADSIFINDNTFATDTSDETYTITIGGLDDNLAYDFTFLSANDLGGANGNVFVRLRTGSTSGETSANAGFESDETNVQAWMQLIGVSPDEGRIQIEVFGTLNNNGRINTMEFAPVSESGIRPSITFDQATSMITLTWTSDPTPGTSYIILANPDFSIPVANWGDIEDTVVTGGEFTTFSFAVDTDTLLRMFYVIEENPVPLPSN